MRTHFRRIFPLILLSCISFLLVSATLPRAESRLPLMEGDEVYACACGPECGCGTLSWVANVCGCGRELVMAKVLRTTDGEAVLLVGGTEKVFRTTGRYACECMENCGCGTISQKPGKCACGRILLPLRKD